MTLLALLHGKILNAWRKLPPRQISTLDALLVMLLLERREYFVHLVLCKKKKGFMAF